jgi:hypothetical protein
MNGATTEANSASPSGNVNSKSQVVVMQVAQPQVASGRKSARFAFACAMTTSSIGLAQVSSRVSSAIGATVSVVSMSGRVGRPRGDGPSATRLGVYEPARVEAAR